MSKKKYPEYGTVFYTLRIDSYAKIHVSIDEWNEEQFDIPQFNSGNFYLTKREAEAARRQLTKLVKDFFKKGKQE